MQETRGAALTDRGSARARVLFLVTACSVVVADQLTKAWALARLSGGRRIDIFGRHLGLELVHNPGAAFGLFPSATALLTLAALGIVAYVTYRVFAHGEMPLSFGLVMGGGLGNLIDRLLRPPSPLRGEVVDFIHTSFWPTFNIADSSIVLGVALVLLVQLRSRDA